MDLGQLNERWRTINHAHAIPAKDEGLFYLHCPNCQHTGIIGVPLEAAMSDVLAHKNQCTAPAAPKTVDTSQTPMLG